MRRCALGYAAIFALASCSFDEGRALGGDAGSAADARENGDASSTLKSSELPRPDDLVGYWPLDGDAFDQGPLGHHGSLQGNAAFSGEKKSEGSQSVKLDGVDGHVIIGDVLELLDSDFSISVWARIDTSTPSTEMIKYPLVDKFRSGGNYRLYIDEDGEIEFGLRNESNSVHKVISFFKNHDDDEDWHHVMATFSEPDTMRLYADGVIAGELVSQEAYIRGDTSSPLYFGVAPNNTAFFRGQLDDVAIWRSALGAREIFELYERQKQSFADPER